MSTTTTILRQGFLADGLTPYFHILLGDDPADPDTSTVLAVAGDKAVLHKIASTAEDNSLAFSVSVLREVLTAIDAATQPPAPTPVPEPLLQQ